MRSLTSAGDRIAALLILVILSAALLLAGCYRPSSSSPTAVPRDSSYFRVVDLSTCRRVITPWPTAAYDGERSHQRFANWRPIGTPIQPDTIGRPSSAVRADTGVDPFHCGADR